MILKCNSQNYSYTNIEIKVFDGTVGKKTQEDNFTQNIYIGKHFMVNFTHIAALCLVKEDKFH